MSSLRKSAVSGVKWNSFALIGNTFLQYCQLFVLARLLEPNDFGIVGMITVVIGFSQAFADMGMSNAIIWKQKASQDQLSSLYWLNIASGIVLFLIIAASAPIISGFYGEPGLKSLVHLAALVFLITPIGQQFQMIMQRELQFGRLAKIEVAGTFIGVSTAIVTAALGNGAHSIIYGQLANAGIRSLALAWVGWSNWRPCIHFSFKDLKGFIGFGMYQMGERSLNYFTANVDYVMVGRFLGADVLGVYMIAYKVIVMPFQKINPVLTRVAFPVFAKKQDDYNVLCRGYKELSKILALCTAPVIALIAALSPVVVPVVFGDKWTEAVPLIQILSIMGILKTLNNPVGSVFMAIGRADIGFFKNLCSAVIATAVFWYAAQRGVFFMAWTEVLVALATFIAFIIILNVVLGLNVTEYLLAISKPLAISALTGIAVYGFYMLVGNALRNEILLLIVSLALGTTLYLLMAFLTERDLIKNYWRYARGKGGGIESDAQAQSDN